MEKISYFFLIMCHVHIFLYILSVSLAVSQNEKSFSPGLLDKTTSFKTSNKKKNEDIFNRARIDIAQPKVCKTFFIIKFLLHFGAELLFCKV